MSFLLDSNVVIRFLDDDPSTIEMIRALEESSIYVSVITVMEVRHGLVKTGQESLDRFEAFLAIAPALDINSAIASRCADLRSSLTTQGKTARNRTLDLLIASTAIHHDLELVTFNPHDFRDIPGLLLHR